MICGRAEAFQRLCGEASSVEKSIKLFDGFLDDLLFEPEREDITQDIIDWLNSRCHAFVEGQKHRPPGAREQWETKPKGLKLPGINLP
ncbi:hypothetical protein QJS10_CPA07g00280 [Acorus calamus]|uniref:Uncharacterized protein n=1 Tax=Acorus calamus TaxID=4465 RepID=A0AAV9EH48_ACOCL|nr:hypothetical protein QJS10_CPA07g00280 [Acorus calamus]